MGAFTNLDLDSIVDDDNFDLFEDPKTQDDTTPDEESQDEENEDSSSKDDNNKIDTSEIDPDTLFEDPKNNKSDKSESVGSENEKDIKGKEDASSDTDSDSSKTDFFSSIATALVDEGILPDLDEETVKNIKTDEDLRKAINDHIDNELDAKQKRVLEALDNNVEPDMIKQYENVLDTLNSVSEDFLKEESNEAANVRKNLIYQDFLNRGFSQERAKRELERSIKAGSDIEDAIEALASNKDYYNDSYKDLLEEAKEKQEEERTKIKKEAETIKKNIMDSKNTFFGDLNPDKATRQKIYDNIAKPVYKDPKTGQIMTAVQKYIHDNNEEFQTKLGIIYTLTNGFEDLTGLTKDKIKKEVKKGFKSLESKINHSNRDSYGNLKYASGSGGIDGFGEGVEVLA